MEKKSKLSDLKDQTTVLKADEQTRNVTRISMDELKDLTRVLKARREEKAALPDEEEMVRLEDLDRPKVAKVEKKKVPKIKEEPFRAVPEKKIVIENVLFQRGLLKAVTLKAIGLAIVLGV